MRFKLQFSDVSCKACANVVARVYKALPYVLDFQFTDDFQEATVTAVKDIPQEWLRAAALEAGYSLVEPICTDGGIHA